MAQLILRHFMQLRLCQIRQNRPRGRHLPQYIGNRRYKVVQNQLGRCAGSASGGIALGVEDRCQGGGRAGADRPGENGLGIRQRRHLDVVA